LCEAKNGLAGFSIGDGKTGEVWVVAVLPEFERMGIGSKLLTAVEDWLHELGWKELWLWTSADPNKRAFSFYQNRGWVVSDMKGDKVTMKKRMPS
jgi:GNAT superfamily N-acetyltransferase